MEKQDTNNTNNKKSVLWILAIIGLSFINYLWPVIVIFALYEFIKKLITKSQFFENVSSKPVANEILS